MDAHFSKSILRSLVIDGGIDLADSVRIVDLLTEFSHKSSTVTTIGTWAGAGQAAIGFAFMSSNPVGLIVMGLGAFTFWKARSHCLSQHDKRELLLLNKHRRLIQLLGYLHHQQMGNEDEILSSYESLIGNYDYARDQIIYDGNVIPAAQLIEMLPGMVQARQQHRVNEFTNETISALQPEPEGESGVVPSAPEPGQYLPQVLQSPPATLQNTRLNALNAPATRVVQAGTAPYPQHPLAAAVPSPVDYLIGDRLRTALIASVSGGGKDMLLSNALRAFLTLYPAFSVIVMDCKDDSKEYGYYDHLPQVQVYRLNLAVASESSAGAWIDAVIDDFNKRPEKVLLLCNEGTLVREKSKRYVDVIDALVSSGDSREKYAWEAGQSGHTDDLKINAAARSRMRPMVIGMSGEEMQIEAILRARWLADTANDMTAMRSELRRSPVSRAWSDGQRWYPMPELINYAGYDRDSRSFTSAPVPASANAEIKQNTYQETTPKTVSIFVELAQEYVSLNDETIPLMADFIKWLSGKRNEVITKRNAILLWGNKQSRNVTRNEAIDPYLGEALELGLLIATPDGYRVL